MYKSSRKGHCSHLATWYTIYAPLNIPQSGFQRLLISRLQLQLDSERLDCFALRCIWVAANVHTGMFCGNAP